MNIQAVKSFNTVSERFISTMIETFPQNNKLKVYDTKFKTSKKMDITAPVKVFYDMLHGSGLYIMSRDLVHFRENKDFENELGILERWDEYDVELQNTIWEYMQSLYILCMTSMNEKDRVSEIVSGIKGETSVES